MRSMRIVSLLASATEIVCALDAGDLLVGRSHECDNPAWVTRLPRCSEPAFDISVSSREIDEEVRRRLHAGEPLYVIHSELIRELKPDLVITQTHCEVCAVTPRDVERSGACAIEARQVALSASSLEEIFDGILRIAGELGYEDRGRALIAREKARLENVQRRTAGRARPRVAVLEWTDPLFEMGNWGPELVEIANGEPALGRKGEMSAAIDARRLIAADPDWLIVAPCGFGLKRGLRERPLLEAQPWWRELKAVRESRVAFADGNRFFNRSGMTVAPTAEMIAEILHGVLFDGSTEGVYWCRV
jgi:iron complex transport system substrate-binding protein